MYDQNRTVQEAETNKMNLVGQGTFVGYHRPVLWWRGITLQAIALLHALRCRAERPKAAGQLPISVAIHR